MSIIAQRSAMEVQAAESRAMARDALDAVHRVNTPSEAEELLAKVKVAAEAARVMHLGKALSREWRNIELKAERKWGELLGKADRSANAAAGRIGVSATDTKTSAEREAVREARKLAAVPEPVFEKYVETTDTPTKAGVLRAANAETTEEQIVPPADTAHESLTTRQQNVANAARDRVEKTLHTLDGMCVGLAGVDPLRATTTSTEEQIEEWLVTAERARSNLRQFTAALRRVM